MDNKQALELLTKLQETAQNQDRQQYVDALDVAIKLVKENLSADDASDKDIDLSATPADQLLQLAERVKNDSTPRGELRRRAASIYLARLAKN